MNEIRTDPPPSPEARALRAVGRELDTLGDAFGELAAGVQALAEMGEADARTLGQLDRKIDTVIALLKEYLPRTEALETWRREHELEHVRQ